MVSIEFSEKDGLFLEYMLGDGSFQDYEALLPKGFQKTEHDLVEFDWKAISFDSQEWKTRLDLCLSDDGLDVKLKILPSVKDWKKEFQGCQFCGERYTRRNIPSDRYGNICQGCEPTCERDFQTVETKLKKSLDIVPVEERIELQAGIFPDNYQPPKNFALYSNIKKDGWKEQIWVDFEYQMFLTLFEKDFHKDCSLSILPKKAIPPYKTRDTSKQLILTKQDPKRSQEFVHYIQESLKNVDPRLHPLILKITEAGAQNAVQVMDGNSVFEITMEELSYSINDIYSVLPKGVEVQNCFGSFETERWYEGKDSDLQISLVFVEELNDPDIICYISLLIFHTKEDYLEGTESQDNCIEVPTFLCSFCESTRQKIPQRYNSVCIDCYPQILNARKSLQASIESIPQPIQSIIEHIFNSSTACVSFIESEREGWVCTLWKNASISNKHLMQYLERYFFCLEKDVYEQSTEDFPICSYEGRFLAPNGQAIVEIDNTQLLISWKQEKEN